jgi:hypothetical protein
MGAADLIPVTTGMYRNTFVEAHMRYDPTSYDPQTGQPVPGAGAYSGFECTGIPDVVPGATSAVLTFELYNMVGVVFATVTGPEFVVSTLGTPVTLAKDLAYIYQNPIFYAAPGVSRIELAKLEYLDAANNVLAVKTEDLWSYYAVNYRAMLPPPEAVDATTALGSDPGRRMIESDLTPIQRGSYDAVLLEVQLSGSAPSAAGDQLDAWIGLTLTLPEVAGATRGSITMAFFNKDGEAFMSGADAPYDDIPLGVEVNLNRDISEVIKGNQTYEQARGCGRLMLQAVQFYDADWDLIEERMEEHWSWYSAPNVALIFPPDTAVPVG